MHRGAGIELKPLAAALLLVLAACGPASGDGPEAGAATAVFLGAIRVDDVAKGNAGLSGLAITPDGRTVTMLDDRSFVWEARVRRTGGRPEALGPVTRHALRRATGAPMYGLDSEGLHRLPDGTLAVSYEGFHGILLHRPPDWRGSMLRKPVGLTRLPRNEGIEALAGLPDGTLIAIAEGRRQGRHPVWRIAPGGVWETLRPLYVPGGFRPVGADLGPDGRLYVLERAYGPTLRFRSRVRSFVLGPEGLEDPQAVLTTEPGRFGNLEGIAVWRGAGGRLRITMVSDDNGWDWLPAELVEFALPADSSADTPAETPAEATAHTPGTLDGGAADG